MALSDDPRDGARDDSALRDALFSQTARKAAVSWLTYDSPAGAVRDRLVWHVWHDGALLVATGEGEQQLPPPPDGAEVDVALRSSDTGGLLVRQRCRARTVLPTDPDWEGCAAALLAGRLNHGPASETLDRWRGSVSFHLLTP